METSTVPMECNSITFIGFYDKGNTGDQAYKEVLSSYFGPHTSFVDFEVNRIDGETYVIGCGDLINQYYLDMLPDNTRYYMYCVGAQNDYLINQVLSGARELNGIWVRNTRQVAMVSKLVRCKCEYVPDITFKKKVHHTWTGKSNKLTVIMNAHVILHKETKELTELARVLDSADMEISFLPMCINDDVNDVELAKKVASLMKSNNFKILGQQTPDSVMKEVADSRMVVSMRLHGLIFSAMAGTPFVSLGAAPKLSYFCEDSTVPYASCKHPIRLKSAMKLVADREESISESLRIVSKANRILVEDSLEEVSKEWLPVQSNVYHR
jgi:polysaccharide pyruvyl transferase WcaK-like protein